MKDKEAQTSPDSSEPISSIQRKLQANEELLKQYPNFGRLTWRRKRKNGEMEIELEIKL